MNNIIQHHQPIDFDSLFKRRNDSIGIDDNDLKTLADGAKELHSFFGEAEGDNRVQRAFDNALGSDEAAGILGSAKAMIVAVFQNRESNNPINISELNALRESIERFEKYCDIIWSVMDEPSLTDKVEIIVMVKI